MPDKPTTRAGYTPNQIESVRATCLYIATKLGDVMDDLVIVGGLVPSLLVDQSALGEDVERHVGTLDLDVGLSLAVFDAQRYRTLSERLRAAGFKADENEKGNRTSQRWQIDALARVTVDFLIPSSVADDKGGRIHHLEADFAALTARGLHLAFQDKISMPLTGETIVGEKASRMVHVCGPGAYVVLKALAFANRGENKDAYDLHYVVRNYGVGPRDVADRFLALRPDLTCEDALAVLRRDFLDPDGLGPRRVAAFLRGEQQVDDELQADVAGFVGSFVDMCQSG